MQSKTKDKKNTVFGEQFLTEASSGHTESLESWDWKPAKTADFKFISESASIPGTTGTGPNASSDERPDEM